MLELLCFTLVVGVGSRLGVFWWVDYIETKCGVYSCALSFCFVLCVGSDLRVVSSGVFVLGFGS